MVAAGSGYGSAAKGSIIDLEVTVCGLVNCHPPPSLPVCIHPYQTILQTAEAALASK